MSQMKLFGSKRSGARLAKNRSGGAACATQTRGSAAPKRAKQRNPLKTLAIVLACVLLL